jgi:hypothetical protein
MAFDPDKYLAGDNFDPDVYLSKEDQERKQPLLSDMRTITPREEPSKVLSDIGEVTLGAADRGYNAFMFGMGDRIGALGQAVRSYDRGEGFNYSDELAKARAKAEAFSKEHPVASTAAEVAGAVGSGLALGGAGGLTLLRPGMSLGPAMIAGAVEGGLYGAAQGAGNTYTGKLPDYLVNAGYGGALGTVLGPPAVALGHGAKVLGRRGELPRQLEDAAVADQQGIRNLPQYGPDGMLVDAGPAMRGVGQGAVLGTGAAAGDLKSLLRTRDEGTVQRVTEALDRTLGVDPVPSIVQRQIRVDQQALGPAYNEAFRNARAVDSRPIAEHIDVLLHERQGNPAILQQVRQLLDVPNNPGVLDPYPRTLQNVREHIDLLMGGGDLDNGSRAALTQLRQRITEELHAKVPGIVDLDRQFAELARQREALERGGQVFGTGTEAVRPVELAQTINAPTASAQQFQRLQQGARGELERIVGTNVNDLLKLERVIGEPQDWNAQKLTMLFGPERADRMVRVLDANREFRRSYQDIVQGSQTAQRQAARDALEAPRVSVGRGDTMWGDVKNIFRNASQERADRLALENRERIARLLATRGPEMEQLANQLLGQGPRRASREQIIDALVNSSVRTGGYPATYINR